MSTIKIKSSHERLPLANLPFERWKRLRNEKLVYDSSSSTCWLPVRLPAVEPGVAITLEIGHVSVKWKPIEGIVEYRCVPFQLNRGRREREACMASIRIILPNDGTHVTTIWIAPEHREHWPYFLTGEFQPLPCSVCANGAARYAAQIQRDVFYCSGECAINHYQK